MPKPKGIKQTDEARARISAGLRERWRIRREEAYLSDRYYVGSIYGVPMTGPEARASTEYSIHDSAFAHRVVQTFCGINGKKKADRRCLKRNKEETQWERET